MNVIKVLPESAIKFGSFEVESLAILSPPRDVVGLSVLEIKAAKKAMAHLEGADDVTKISSFSRFVAGGIGGVVSQSVFPDGWCGPQAYLIRPGFPYIPSIP